MDILHARHGALFQSFLPLLPIPFRNVPKVNLSKETKLGIFTTVLKKKVETYFFSGEV